MQIHNTVNQLVKCWSRAEEQTRHIIANKYYDADEDNITFLLIGELREQLENANKDRLFEHAFLDDLQTHLDQQSVDLANPYQLNQITSGLVASVKFHPREVEKKTGGDFGMVIKRPNVLVTTTEEQTTIQIDFVFPRGILCQTKVTKRKITKRHTGIWGPLTPHQRSKTLPDRLVYLALVLYRYADQDRRNLKPFEWQPCNELSINDIVISLKYDEFKGIEPSSKIISRLANGLIGTKDEKTISEVICPATRNSLEIVIDWKEGKRPPLIQVLKNKETQKLLVASS